MDTAGLIRGAQAADRVAQSMDRADREAAQFEQRTRRVAGQMSVLGAAAQQLALQLAAAFSIGAVIRANDAWVSATNQIRLVTQSTAELRDITEEVFQLSQRTASRFEGMTGLYASIQRAAGEAIGSQREVLRITETIAKLAAASGGPEGSRNAALFQLRQMLQGAVVQAQEFNSLVDGTPLLVQAIADSLGVTRGELRRMVLDGRLATSQVIAALQEQADEADAIFSRVQFTVGDAFTKLQNAFQKLVGTNLGPLFRGVVSAVSALAENLDALVPVLSGVAAAFAVAFAPTVVVAMAGAVKALFVLIAAHPLAALVGAIVAAGVAIDRFGDQITVTQVQLKGLGEAAADGAGDVADELTTINVSLRDMFGGLLQVISEDVQGLISQLPRVTQAAADETAAALEQSEVKWYEYGGAVDQFVEKWGNRIIGAFREIGFTLAHAWDTMVIVADLAWKKIQNAALGALESIANAAQDHLIFGGGDLPDIRLGRVDTSEAEASLREFQDRNQAVIESFYNEDYMGNFRRRVMDAAATIAAARRVAGGGDEEDDDSTNPPTPPDPTALAALEKQIKARQELFDALEAQLALNEREYEIYEQTEDLLRQFPDFYRQAAAGAEDVAVAARAAAEADARRLDSLRRHLTAQASLKQLAREAASTDALIASARQGADALEIEERTRDLLEEHAELYEQMGKGAEAAARAEAARQIAAERTLDALTAQAERAREIAEAPAVNLLEGLQNATDDFWTAFVDKGFGAFDDLGDALKNVFKRLQADILRAIFNPISQGITQAVQGALGLGGASPSAGGGFGSIFQGIFGGGGGNAGGLSGGALGSLGRILSGGGSGGLGGGLGGLGGMVSGGWASVWQALGGGILNAGAPLAFTPGIGAANAAWGAQGLLGGIGSGIGLGSLGGLVSGLLGIGGGSGIGSSIGGIAGSFFGPIGSIVGGFLGDAIEGLFSGGVTSAQTALDLNASGQITRGPWGVGGDDEMTAQTQQGVTAAAQRIAEGQDVLRQLGGTLNAYVAQISIAEQRQRSGVRINSTATGQEVAVVHTNTIGDPEDLVQTALGEVLKRTNFADPVLEAVRAAMTGAGKGFEETLEVLGKLKEVLPATEEQTSQWKQALDTLNETFADLRASTAGVAGVAAQLDEAFASAKEALKGRFAESIEDAITAIESPLTLQLEQLMKVQAQRLADATALGADVARVMHLNELELTSFIEKAGGSAEAFEQLNAIFADLIAKAEAAGQATAPLIDAYNQARTGVVDAFDKSIADQFAQLTNPTLAALRQLLDAQKSRLDQARAIGANIIAVERLNALEQKAFFDGLTADQKTALADYLGLIEDFTGRIGVVLGQLQDELGTRIDQTEQMRNDLLQQSDTMRQLAENLTSLRQGIVDRYGALSPMAGVEALRERFAALAQDARGGNDSALQALGQVGQQLIEASRALYGSTTTFRGDYDLVTQVLEEAAGLAGERADALTSQAETLLQQRDLLIEIRDILSSPDPSLTLLEDHLDALDQNQDVVAALLRQYLQLQAQQSAQQVDLGSLIGSATQQAQTPPLPTSTASQTQTPVNPSASGATPTSTVGGAGATTSGVQAAAEATAQMVAVLTDVMQQGLDTMTDNQERTNRELRNLNDRLGVGGATA
jgi:tape measure domain-containing protein